MVGNCNSNLSLLYHFPKQRKSIIINPFGYHSKDILVRHRSLGRLYLFLDGACCCTFILKTRSHKRSLSNAHCIIISAPAPQSGRTSLQKDARIRQKGSHRFESEPCGFSWSRRGETRIHKNHCKIAPISGLCNLSPICGTKSEWMFLLMRRSESLCSIRSLTNHSIVQASVFQQENRVGCCRMSQ